jgi:hypothetical protein
MLRQCDWTGRALRALPFLKRPLNPSLGQYRTRRGTLLVLLL